VVDASYGHSSSSVTPVRGSLSPLLRGAALARDSSASPGHRGVRRRGRASRPAHRCAFPRDEFRCIVKRSNPGAPNVYRQRPVLRPRGDVSAATGVYLHQPEEGELRWVGETSRYFLATGEQTGGAFTLVDEQAKRGESVPLHLHRDAAPGFARCGSLTPVPLH
jgi:hypothetical protein